MANAITDLVRGMWNPRAAAVPVAMLAVLAGGLFIFLEIADEVAEGEMRRIDEALFLMLRDPETLELLGPPWLEETAVEITALGGYPLIILAVGSVIGFLLVIGRWGPALYVFLSVGSGALISQTLKQYYGRPRPDLVEHLDPVHTASFPSGHALVTTVAYLTLGSLIMRLVDGWAVRVYVLAMALFVAAIVGLSRVYVGVHWPSDVAAGWAVGAAWASLTWLVVSALQHWRRRQKDAPDDA
ncbi:phosphatase PAP2 family protein [Aquibium sp. A9E412]|uniref:phosphatase PAP2 family protein n=1 Tax=Aquibium sp. A9E412 TaxID=2976767 RepID=UPI0025B052EB|nr:phosphatase PAP2 family protein [Aquibium sp. A9E412]MDN2566988.1 phosphatase PAP2 family protein [Aquibium sp. A9E412]